MSIRQTASKGRLKLALRSARRFDPRLLGLHVIQEPEVPPLFQAEPRKAIARNAERDQIGMVSEIIPESGATSVGIRIVGGTTQDLLEKTMIPVLISR